MIALQITELKQFMNTLLRTPVFDSFEVSELRIDGMASYHIEGHLQKDFFSPEELEEKGLAGAEYLPYGLLRQNCFDLIKGSHVPLFFRFVLFCPKERSAELLAEASLTENDVSALCLILTYSRGKLSAATGVSYRGFVLSHELDSLWDREVKLFFEANKISYDIV